MATQEQILCFAPGSLRESLEREPGTKFTLKGREQVAPGVKQGEGVKHLVPTRYQSKTIDGDVAAR
jgi:hypothetical protein